MAITYLLLSLSLTLAAQGAPAAPPAAAQSADKSALNEELLDAARQGDVARVTRALERGADVNAGNRYKATALFFAADKGHLAVVDLLLDKGADANIVDTFYKMRAIDMAMSNDHEAIALRLLERGSKGAAGVLQQGIRAGNTKLVQAALGAADLTPDEVRSALGSARRGKNLEIIAAIERKAAVLPPDPTAVTVERAVLESYAGAYRDDTQGATWTVSLSNDQLALSPAPGNVVTLVPTSTTNFKIAEAPNVSITFSGRGGMVERFVLTQPNQPPRTFTRSAPGAATPPGAPAAAATGAAPAAAATVPPPVAPRTAPRPWPAFRGANASGNGDGQGSVSEWDAASGRNIRWKTPIPGIANASPVVWGNKVFVVTAISAADDKTFRTGLYGDVKPVEDLSVHTWKMFCLDKTTGRILWERTAFTGAPKVKRHTKASQANSTPATDGSQVVALFGSIGLLAAWDMNGKPLWTRDIGVLDSGWFFDPTYQWGHSSSPIIHDGRVIVQADMQKRSFIAAFDVRTGKQMWRTERDEISSWGTPTIFSGPAGAQIVTNAPTIRGYDPATGKELWKLGPNSEVTVGTPVVGDGLVYITGGYPPVRPVYAVKPGASGDISMPKDKTSTDVVAWSNTSGTYIPTPLYYDGILYTCGNDGVLSAYDAKSGERIYRTRVGGGGSFSASPVAADGKLYFANEDGDVIVARAGRKYEEIAKNSMKEVIMSTPAISDGLIVVRTLGHVYGVGQK
jgi:outer membrane protein assembly factor BamB